MVCFSDGFAAVNQNLRMRRHSLLRCGSGWRLGGRNRGGSAARGKAQAAQSAAGQCRLARPRSQASSLSSSDSGSSSSDSKPHVYFSCSSITVQRVPESTGVCCHKKMWPSQKLGESKTDARLSSQNCLHVYKHLKRVLYVASVHHIMQKTMCRTVLSEANENVLCTWKLTKETAGTILNRQKRAGLNHPQLRHCNPAARHTPPAAVGAKSASCPCPDPLMCRCLSPVQV